MNLRINTSDISRAFENEGLCENNDIQQKSQELDKTDDKNLDLNQHDSNLLKDLTDFTSKYFNSRFKNVDYNLYNFSSSITAENNLVPHSFTRSTVTKHVPRKQYCTFKQTTNDTKRLKFQTVMKMTQLNILTLRRLGMIILIYYYIKIKMI